MNVWIMNLLDNRAEEDKPKALPKSKFQFCKERGIVGIGWVGYDLLEAENIGFLRAHNAISAFRKDDLVWTKDPDSKKYYICRITAEVHSASDVVFHQYDISEFCACEFIEVGTEEKLPSGILKEELISRTAISKANLTIAESTQVYINALILSAPSVSQTPNVQTGEKENNTRKKKPNIKKIVLLLAIPLFILVFVLIGSAVYKGIHPVLPYNNTVKLGDQLTEVKSKISYTSEEVFGDENEYTLLKEDFSESGVGNTEHFYPRLHIPFAKSDGDLIGSNYIDYIFDASDELSSIDIMFYCPFPESRMVEVLDYYEAALGTKDYKLETSINGPGYLIYSQHKAEFRKDGYRIYIQCYVNEGRLGGMFFINIGKDNTAKK